ncbi:MAG: pyridoxamine 5'-phosphate oxidase family protein [Acidimicrobiales bacterium]
MTTIDERTGLEILDEAACWALVNNCSVGRLAVAVGGRPDIFPMNYAVDDGSLVFLTLPGIKLAAAGKLRPCRSV